MNYQKAFYILCFIVYTIIVFYIGTGFSRAGKIYYVAQYYEEQQVPASLPVAKGHKK